MASMHVEFSLVTNDDTRIGQLVKTQGNTSIVCNTPCIAVPTFRGVPKLLLWEEIDDILGDPHNYIASIPLCEMLIRTKKQGGVHAARNSSVLLPSNPPYFLLATFGDTLRTTPSVVGARNRLYLESSEGRLLYSDQDAVDALALFNPDLVICPAEEVPIDPSFGTKRPKRSLHQAQHFVHRFFTSFLHKYSLHNACGVAHESPACTDSPSSVPRLLLNAQGRAFLAVSLSLMTRFFERSGGCDPSIRQEAADAGFLKNISDQGNHFIGTYVGDVSTATSLYTSFSALEASVQGMKHTPSPRVLRVATISGTPPQLIQAVWCGMDIMEISWFIFAAAEKGFAFVFNPLMSTLPPAFTVKDPIQEVQALFSSATNGVDNGVRVLDLRRRDVFSHDSQKLTPHTICTESRAFVHHLINCNEMLGSILLAKHNLYLIGRLLAQLKSALAVSREACARYILWFYQTQLDDDSLDDRSTPTVYLTPKVLLNATSMKSYTAQYNPEEP